MGIFQNKKKQDLNYSDDRTWKNKVFFELPLIRKTEKLILSKSDYSGKINFTKLSMRVWWFDVKEKVWKPSRKGFHLRLPETEKVYEEMGKFLKSQGVE